MKINRTDERLFKPVEEWNKQEKNMYINFDKQTLEYIGIYSLLDELINRIKKCNDINIIEKYCNCYEKIYKLTKGKLGEIDE